MQHFKLKKGLNIPASGAPVQEIGQGRAVSTVAAVGDDYIGLKPRVFVAEDDVVSAGTPLFAHKDTPDAVVVSPVTGRVKAINRGARRVLQSVVIQISEKLAEPIDFTEAGDAETAEGITEKLCKAGLWTSFRTRPYSKVPEPGTQPKAIYVTAMDTEPLCADAGVIIADDPDAFAAGLEVVAKLSAGKTYVCHAPGEDIPGASIEGVETASFEGPHPAGLAGTHIHFLEPPTASEFVWTIWYQDVIAIGRLVQTGKISSERIVALSGPLCHQPRLVRTVAGASLADLTRSEFDDSVPVRMVSGSILSGRAASGPTAYLGRYDRQITLIEEDKKQIPMGWIRPMPSKYALQPVLGSALSRKIYPLTSNLNGGRRAMVPIGTFEKLMPQDFLPTQLLRALLVMDTDAAQKLGALELDEEDLGLVGFACPAKYEYMMALRDCLTKIEKEG
ncbi:MAG: Na(+)-translocating NADH-quinone reductase subunit A [Pseudomonadota bacterium]